MTLLTDFRSLPERLFALRPSDGKVCPTADLRNQFMARAARARRLSLSGQPGASAKAALLSSSRCPAFDNAQRRLGACKRDIVHRNRLAQTL